MSRSTSTPPQAARSRHSGVRLEVVTNEDAEVYVLGGAMQTVAYGVHKIDEVLPPGIYKLRAVRGGATKERLVELSDEPVTVDLQIEAFGAIAPVTAALGKRSPAVEAVARRAIGAGERCTVFEGGSGGRHGGLLVLGHMPAGGEAVDPLENIRLFPWRRHVERRRLECEASAEPVGDESWRGWYRRCAPGTYVLDLHDGAQWVRQAVLVIEGWETRIFLRRAASGAAPELSIQMAAPGTKIVYRSDEDQSVPGSGGRSDTVEVARRALETGRPAIVADRFIERLLHQKWRNPIMGLMGLHLFLEALERSEAAPGAAQRRRVDLSGRHIKDGEYVVREVIGNLRRLLMREGQPYAADLAGLETRAARFLEPVHEPKPAIDHPPMFWASWIALRDAPEEMARFDVQHRLWTDTAHCIAAGPYFAWKARQGSLSSYVETAMAATVASAAAIAPILPIGMNFALPTILHDAALRSKRGAMPPHFDNAPPQPEATLELPTESKAEVAKALGIPASVIKSL
jgi:hypothetical protein